MGGSCSRSSPSSAPATQSPPAALPPASHRSTAQGHKVNHSEPLPQRKGTLDAIVPSHHAGHPHPVKETSKSSASIHASKPLPSHQATPSPSLKPSARNSKSGAMRVLNIIQDPLNAEDAQSADQLGSFRQGADHSVSKQNQASSNVNAENLKNSEKNRNNAGLASLRGQINGVENEPDQEQIITLTTSTSTTLTVSSTRKNANGSAAPKSNIVIKPRDKRGEANNNGKPPIHNGTGNAATSERSPAPNNPSVSTPLSAGGAVPSYSGSMQLNVQEAGVNNSNPTSPNNKTILIRSMKRDQKQAAQSPLLGIDLPASRSSSPGPTKINVLNKQAAAAASAAHNSPHNTNSTTSTTTTTTTTLTLPKKQTNIITIATPPKSSDSTEAERIAIIAKINEMKARHDARHQELLDRQAHLAQPLPLPSATAPAADGLSLYLLCWLLFGLNIYSSSII